MIVTVLKHRRIRHPSLVFCPLMKIDAFGLITINLNYYLLYYRATFWHIRYTSEITIEPDFTQ